MARPTKLTPQVQKRICDLLAAGNTRRAAAECAGITDRTLYAWLQRGEVAKSGPFLQFLRAVEKAEAEAEAVSVLTIRQAARESWQAAAWWLERRRPHDWGRIERHEHTGAEGTPIQVEDVTLRRVRELDDDELRERAGRALRVIQGGTVGCCCPEALTEVPPCT